MRLIGNILWLILGGFIIFVLYLVAGLLACCTVVGIPFGLQLWKLGGLAFSPFGKEVSGGSGQGCFSSLANVLWVLLGWWEIALIHLFFGIICAVTIVGIPFAKQHFKLMKLSFLPFGLTVK